MADGREFVNSIRKKSMPSWKFSFITSFDVRFPHLPSPLRLLSRGCAFLFFSLQTRSWKFLSVYWCLPDWNWIWGQPRQLNTEKILIYTKDWGKNATVLPRLQRSLVKQSRRWNALELFFENFDNASTVVRRSKFAHHLPAYHWKLFRTM